MTSIPQPLSQWIQPEKLRLLLSPSDLIILAVLLSLFVLGYHRGLVRTVFGWLTGGVAFLGASFCAKAAAPRLAELLVTPLVGEAFSRQAERVLSGALGAGSTETLQTLQRLLGTQVIQNAAGSIQSSAMRAAQSMAESLSYVLLFSILLVAFTALLRLIRKALKIAVKIGPISVLNSLAGGFLGLLGGILLVLAVLFVISRFAPATFSPLGTLSPEVLDQTLLTRSLYGILPSNL